MMHVYNFSSQQKVPSSVQGILLVLWTYKWIQMQCENKLGLNIFLRKLRIFIANTFMNITVIVGVCDYIVEMYDFDTRGNTLSCCF